MTLKRRLASLEGQQLTTATLRRVIITPRVLAAIRYGISQGYITPTPEVAAALKRRWERNPE